jgi:uncharacterized protein YdeI (YjbR/CyaY-like superfamily)
MEKITSVTDYIEKHEKWSSILELLRKTVLNSGLTETIKWSAPVYTHKGKNICGLGAFKNHCAIWFFKGVFIEDSHQVLLNAQENKTKELRQWRIVDIDDVNVNVLTEYIQQAIIVEENGLSIPKEKSTKEVIIPKELEVHFNENPSDKELFKAYTKAKQREFCNYIAEAKRESTKLSRIEKIVPLFKDKKGLYDKYKNC